jgi:hypothetical protein
MEVIMVHFISSPSLLMWGSYDVHWGPQIIKMIYNVI